MSTQYTEELLPPDQRDVFHDLVDRLVLNSRALRSGNYRDGAFIHMPAEEYAKQCETVVVDAGNGCGKTEYIRRRAQEGDLVVVPTTGVAEKVFGESKADVFSLMQVINGSRKHKIRTDYKNIYVDDASYTLRVGDKKRDMYTVLASPTVSQTFILLG